ncbi:APC family permease [Carboxydocella sp. JDF658]|uniref:APC family permease n=1 Tax=Carboxydocella sp. JDF658 TaxID=1926600 RepID=UPI0009AC29E6|nr:APC family permease [Carboxydocella sp. JDF658]GAW31087.1 amino acid permease [Carboxydocella sp. JDF658]
MYRILKKLLVGDPMPTSRLSHETMPKRKALAVYASDALSSVAYATEEITLVLALFGAQAMGYLTPISLAIIFLLLIVVLSYRHVIRVYTSGGGSYVVAKENLGTIYGLIAGASLLIDYLLTVSVSISSGTAAITSAFPRLLPYTVHIAIFFIFLLTVINLRGISEASTILAYPPYLFLFSMAFMILAGLWRYYTYGAPPVMPAAQLQPVYANFGLLAILRAFSGGCTALTGVEAVSNGVPTFKEPKARNAIIVLFALGGIAIFLFVGTSLLAELFGVVPVKGETLVSQIAEIAFGGRNWAYYLLQASTALILILAANTSYNGAPLLASRLAADGFLPHFLTIRGDRLVYSNGIILLGAAAAFLVLIFHGDTHLLIPLYAIGVFLSFTLSQIGMVKHWLKNRDRGWQFNLLINAIGAIITGIVTIVIATTKFTAGAWIVIILIPLLVYLFIAIKRHYADVAEDLSTACNVEIRHFRKNTVIIPVSTFTKAVINTVQYARSISPHIIAVTVNTNEHNLEKLQQKWQCFESDIPLVILDSPYRSITQPLVEYLEKLEQEAGPDEIITVLLPEFIPRKWWHFFLHNQTGLILKASLTLKKDVVIGSVPFHLSK